MSAPVAKRVSEMTPEERLESLKAWAEEQKWVRPGECGTLAFGVGGVRDMRAQSYSGPVRLVQAQYSAPIAPPSYETVMSQKAKDENKSGRLKGWLEKRKEKKKDKQRSSSVA